MVVIEPQVRLPLALAWTGAAVSIALLMVQVQASALYGGDFLPVWTAAHSFVRRGGDYALYAYPPGGLFALSPLGLIPFRVARFGWYILQAVLVMGASVGMLRLAKIPLRTFRAAGVIALTPWYWPMLHTLDGMNFTVLILPLYIGALLALRRRRWVLCGLLIGVSLALKPLLAPAVVALLLARQWRAVAVALAVLAGSSAVALLVMPDPSAFVDAVRATFQMNETVPVNTSVWGVGTSYGWSPVVILSARAGALLLCAAALMATVGRHRADLGRIGPQTEIAAIGFLAQSLLFTFAWDHYLILLLPLVVLALGGRTAARHGIFVLGFAASAVAFVHVATPGREAVELRPDNARTCAAMLVMLLGLAVANGKRSPYLTEQTA